MRQPSEYGSDIEVSTVFLGLISGYWSLTEKIVDVTDEVVRDYWQEMSGLQCPQDDAWNEGAQEDASIQLAFSDQMQSGDSNMACSPEFRRDSPPAHTQIRPAPVTPPLSSRYSKADASGSMAMSPDPGFALGAATDFPEINGNHLGAPTGTGSMLSDEIDMPDADANLNLTPFATTISPMESLDGVFLPGSTYYQVHSALRSQMFDTANSRAVTPEQQHRSSGSNHGHVSQVMKYTELETRSASRSSLIPTANVDDLSQELEYSLWKNWTDEVAPWLDKFDDHSHFGRHVPILAQKHPHSRYSVLALSARQLERKNAFASDSSSLALYQEVVRQLIPHLDDRSSAVVASCVVLCVLEMMSC